MEQVEHTELDHPELDDPEFVKKLLHGMAHRIEVLEARLAALEGQQEVP